MCYPKCNKLFITVLLDVCATFYSKIAFIKLDLPTFDLPINNTSLGFFSNY